MQYLPIPPARDEAFARNNYLYLMFAPHVDNSTFVKIGVSLDPVTRLGQLATGSPLKIAHLRAYKVGPRGKTYRVEHEIHYRLANFHVRGEWFEFDMTSENDKQALWGSVKCAIKRATRKFPDVLDISADQIQTACELAAEEKRIGRRKMLNPLDSSVRGVLRSRHTRRIPPREHSFLVDHFPRVFQKQRKSLTGNEKSSEGSGETGPS